MRAAVPREPWSVEREIELGRKNGTFPAVDRAALRLAGSSLSSVANLPSSAATVSVGQATDLLLQFYDGPPARFPRLLPLARRARSSARSVARLAGSS